LLVSFFAGEYFQDGPFSGLERFADSVMSPKPASLMISAVAAFSLLSGRHVSHCFPFFKAKILCKH
jgi:hypothetical protein